MKAETTPVMDYPAARSRGCPFDPPAEYGRLRVERPVSRIRLANGREAWLVTRYEDARLALSDPRFSADRRHPNFPVTVQDRATIEKVPPMMVGLDGAAHARARKAVMGEFTGKQANVLRPRIQAITDQFIDAMLTGERPVDLVAALALPVPLFVICELLGVPYADRDFFEQIAAKVIGRNTTERERVDATAEFRSYLDNLIRSKETSPGDDVLSRQIRKKLDEDGDYDRPEMAGLAWLLLIAGHETTANMISLGALALMRSPEQLAEIRENPDRTPAAVDELLRYFSIVEHLTSRVATEDVQLSGVRIPADDAVVVCLPAADRDESVFENPDSLDFSRDERHHVAFGYGMHQCLGQHLARTELQVVFDTLFTKIPDLRLAVDFEELSYKDDRSFFFGLNALPVTW
jgi:cytochrome P450